MLWNDSSATWWAFLIGLEQYLWPTENQVTLVYFTNTRWTKLYKHIIKRNNCIKYSIIFTPITQFNTLYWLYSTRIGIKGTYLNTRFIILIKFKIYILCFVRILVHNKSFCEKLSSTQVFHSNRINLSPFTKDFRVWETPIETSSIYLRLSIWKLIMNQRKVFTYSLPFEFHIVLLHTTKILWQGSFILKIRILHLKFLPHLCNTLLI